MFKVIVTKNGEEIFTLDPGRESLMPAQSEEREHVLSMLVWAMQQLCWAIPEVPIQEDESKHLQVVK